MLPEQATGLPAVMSQGDDVELPVMYVFPDPQRWSLYSPAPLSGAAVAPLAVKTDQNVVSVDQYSVPFHDTALGVTVKVPALEKVR